MNRRKFAFSWGRKLFFGFSWPLSTLLALLYLRSFIFPETGTDWPYFITTYIGHFGLLNVLVYFLLYCPIIFLMPTYYVSRLWSLLLILTLNLFVLLDALSFSNYHLHVYSYISQLILELGVSNLLGSGGLILISSALLIFAILIWLRGELSWRHMQGRFSNPVKNWYLVVIILCVLISKGLFHYSDIHPKLAGVFPLNYNPARAEGEYHDNRKFFYPSMDLACVGKQNPNLVLIVLKDWNQSEFTEETMPRTFHMKRHGKSYNANVSVAPDSSKGIFSLMYSLPSTYQSASSETGPALFKELNNRKYEIVALSYNDSDVVHSKFKEWIVNRSGEEINSYFLSMHLGDAVSADTVIQDVIMDLTKEDLLKNTYIVITGAHASTRYIPLLFIAPDRKSGEVMHVTSQYDLMPTLLEKMWGCKNAYKAAGVGESLEKTDRDWILAITDNGFKIIDVKNSNVTNVQDGLITDTGSQHRHELIFAALKKMTIFSRPK